MPEYDYLCSECGAFSETRPMADYAEPQPCPGCGVAAPRALLTVPNFATMDAGRRNAHATNERSAHAPALSGASSRHPRNCGCCGPQRKAGTLRAEAVPPAKSFPARRPWMISH